MALLLFLTLLISPSQPQKIGFLVSSTDKYSTTLQQLARSAASTSNVTLVVEEYSPTMRGVIEASCRLVQAGVAVVVAKSTSPHTAVQVGSN